MRKSSHTKRLLTAIGGAVLVTGAAYASSIISSMHTQTSPSTPQAVYAAPARVKTAGCVVSQGLPDTSCTPGAVIATATKDGVCRSGYAGNIRNVPTSEKDAVYAEYGISSHVSGEYEVDHLISLELGGSNDISNLWPEAASLVPGFHQKDALENKLHAEVCNGSIRIDDAQKEIATNWLQYYTAK